jgi:hypothetical protein
MVKVGEDWRVDFEQALGESFGEFISPPVPFEDASPHECCEVVWSVAGRNVTPTSLAALTDVQILALGSIFGEYFDSDAPTREQIKKAIAHTLARWPIGSLGENV